MVFQPGQSGNPGARRREKPFRDALLLAIRSADNDKLMLRKVAEALVAKAHDGDIQAIKEIADRLDGKVAQTTILQGDEEGGPIGITAIEHRIIDPQVIPTIDAEVKVISGG